MIADVPPTPAAHVAACRTEACHRRVIRKRWRRAVIAYGRGLLLARMQCESGGHGGYSLTTADGLHWFAHQFNVGAWAGAGGNVTGGRPVGRWTVHPGRLEQDYRAVVWDGIHGGDAWQHCP